MSAAQKQESSIAHAYAQALLDLATERGQSDQVGSELAVLGQTLRSTPELRAFFTNPSIKQVDRDRLVEHTLSPQLTPLLGHFLMLLSIKGHLAHIDLVADAYRHLQDQKRGKIEVDVVVARQLSPQDLDMVRQRISTAIQREAVIRQRVDESILGGIIIRAGDRLIDGSVRTQLETMRRSMLRSAHH